MNPQPSQMGKQQSFDYLDARKTPTAPAKLLFRLESLGSTSCQRLKLLRASAPYAECQCGERSYSCAHHHYHRPAHSEYSHILAYQPRAVSGPILPLVRAPRLLRALGLIMTCGRTSTARVPPFPIPQALNNAPPSRRPRQRLEPRTSRCLTTLSH